MSTPAEAQRRGARIVVTGAAGFIGSHLTNHLISHGASVVGIDDERTGSWSRVDPACVRVPRDLASMTVDDLAATFDGASLCYHLAAEKHNSASATPQRVIDVNISATQRLLDAAGRAGLRKVVFTSSLYAYGSLGPAPMRETDVLAPITVYGMSKAAGEHLLRVAERNHGLRWSVARLFFVYGPRQFAGGGYKSIIVSNFERIRAGEAPTIYGDGRQALDYVYIDDVVDVLSAMAAPDHDGGTFNVGSGTAITVSDLVDEMVRVSGSASPPVKCPPDWTAGTCRVADTSHTSKSLDWQATTMIPDGLARVWKWMEAPDG
jgi:UDP-glucose 4-epimerase